MRDRGVLVLAVAAAASAWWGHGPPVILGWAAVALALVGRWPLALVVAVVLLVGGRAAADIRGLQGAPLGPCTGWATLVSDPITDATGKVTVDVRLAGRILEATARGDPAGALAERAAGDVVEVSGSRHRLPPGASWLTQRHVAAVLAVERVGAWHDSSVASHVANAARDALERSSTALPERQRGLYLGLVLGDDRDEPPDIADDFRGAGLAHLLAVSGQNVAFTLALAGPVLRRLRLGPRLAATIAVLALFVLVTRAEPSVLRAAAMAAIAALAHAMGREASGLRVLGLAVTGLLVADPFLVHAVGFQLSVAASASILLLARPLARALPGPRPVAEAVAVSVAAQVGVAPLLAVTFGGVPVVGLLANVLAAPAAGPVMSWGVLAGLVGGALGPGAALLLHLPTSLLVGWLALVARRTATLPLGQLGGRELLVAGVGLLGLAAGRAGRGRRGAAAALAPAAAAIVAVALVAPAWALQGEPPLVVHLGRGADLWRRGATVLVVGAGAAPADVLSGLRLAGVDRLDLLVATRSGPATQAVVDAVTARAAPGAVVAADHVASEETRAVGRLVVHIGLARGGPAVDVTVAQ